MKKQIYFYSYTNQMPHHFLKVNHHYSLKNNFGSGFHCIYFTSITFSMQTSHRVSVDISTIKLYYLPAGEIILSTGMET